MIKTVVFKKNTPSAKGAGAVDSYATFLTTRGRLTQSSGNRGFSFGELAEQTSWKLSVRACADLDSNISASVKVEIDSETYTVDSWNVTESRPYYYEIKLNKKRG